MEPDPEMAEEHVLWAVGIAGMNADEMWMLLWTVEVDLLTMVLWIHGSAF
jgi:hypothetical protein